MARTEPPGRLHSSTGSSHGRLTNEWLKRFFNRSDLTVRPRTYEPLCVSHADAAQRRALPAPDRFGPIRAPWAPPPAPGSHIRRALSSPKDSFEGSGAVAISTALAAFHAIPFFLTETRTGCGPIAIPYGCRLAIRRQAKVCLRPLIVMADQSLPAAFRSSTGLPYLLAAFPVKGPLFAFGLAGSLRDLFGSVQVSLPTRSAFGTPGLSLAATDLSMGLSRFSTTLWSSTWRDGESWYARNP